MDRTKITLAVAGLAAGAGLALAYSKYVAKKTEVPVLAASPPPDLEELERLREENVSSPAVTACTLSTRRHLTPSSNY